jgi:hypothetical protein
VTADPLDQGIRDRLLYYASEGLSERETLARTINDVFHATADVLEGEPGLGLSAEAKVALMKALDKHLARLESEMDADGEA